MHKFEPGAQVAMPRRRRLLVGAVPFILTVGSRSALAEVAHVCTPSGFQSLTPSHVAHDPTTNCGVTAAAWQAAMGDTTQGIWSYVTDLSPGTRFTAVLGPAANPSPSDAPSQNPKWRVISSTGSLNPTFADALNNAVTIRYEPSSGPQLAIFDGTFAARLVASLLNASAFNGAKISGHYDGSFNIDVGYVQTEVGKIWAFLTNNDRTGAMNVMNTAIGRVYKVS